MEKKEFCPYCEKERMVTHKTQPDTVYWKRKKLIKIEAEIVVCTVCGQDYAPTKMAERNFEKIRKLTEEIN